MPTYDARCNDCEHVYEYKASAGQAVEQCPRCSGNARRIWTTVPILDKAKDPYEYLDGHIPAPKPVKSFAKDHRKGGKDTT